MSTFAATAPALPLAKIATANRTTKKILFIAAMGYFCWARRFVFDYCEVSDIGHYFYRRSSIIIRMSYAGIGDRGWYWRKVYRYLTVSAVVALRLRALLFQLPQRTQHSYPYGENYFFG